jgi:hypothetical protein
MPKKIPVCAVCGKPVNPSKGSITSDWLGIKGRPRIIVHAYEGLECDRKLPPMHGNGVEVAKVLRKIAAKGLDRIVLFGGVTLEEMLSSAARLDAKERELERVQGDPPAKKRRSP